MDYGKNVALSLDQVVWVEALTKSLCCVLGQGTTVTVPFFAQEYTGKLVGQADKVLRRNL